MPPLKKAPTKEDSDEKNRLREVLAKYKDRTREKDETMIQAEQDWERFQQISVEESRRLGGSESTTHLVKGLDVELLRKQREELFLDSKVEDTPRPAKGDPEILKTYSDMARKILGTSMLRRDRVDYEERKKELFKRISKLGPREKLENFGSSYFEHTRFVFRDDSEVPIVVMRSQYEVEEERARRDRMNLVRIRRDPECIEIVKEALKRIKSSRRKKVHDKHTPLMPEHTQAKDEEDEIDIFKDLTLNTEKQRRPEVNVETSTRPLFSEEQQQAELPLLLPTKPAPRSPKNSRQEEDELFGNPLEFGAKLDLSKFRDAEEDPKSKKQKVGNEKQIFQQVMKKVDQMK